MMIPNYQALPLPAPIWLLQTLVIIGFFTHAIPMNIVLGGPVLSVIFKILGRGDSKNAEYFSRISKSLSDSLPLFMSFAITQGVVPLLFLQLLYGPFFYTSSVLMAVPWLSVIFVLIIGYYLLYIYKMSKSPNIFLLIVAFAIFLTIGFIFSNNMTLMLSPEKWHGMFAKNSMGLNLNLGEAQLLPRFIHITLSAIPVTGLLVGIFGLHNYAKDKNYAEFLIKTGSGIFMAVTLLQIFVGGWFLMSIPREQMLNFMGRDLIASSAFIAGLALTIVSIICAGVAWNSANRAALRLTIITALVTILDMIVMRHLLREWSIGKWVAEHAPAVSIQWDLLIAFAVLAVGLIIYITWLVKLMYKGFRG